MKRIVLSIFAILVLLFANSTIFAQTVNVFRIPPDQSGTYASYVRLAPTWVDALALTANVAQADTPPTGARYVIISANCSEYYGNVQGVAAKPGANVTNGSSSELNPAAWFIEGNTSLSFLATATCVITLSYYK